MLLDDYGNFNTLYLLGKIKLTTALQPPIYFSSCYSPPIQNPQWFLLIVIKGQHPPNIHLPFATVAVNNITYVQEFGILKSTNTVGIL